MPLNNATSVKTYDVVVVGALWNTDMAWAEALSRKGLRCAVMRHPNEAVPDAATLAAPLEHFSLDQVYLRESAFWAYRFFRRAHCVLSGTGAIIWHLGPLWPLLPLLPFPPIFNLTTGSDINELAVDPGLFGRFYRMLLRRAVCTFVHPYPIALANLRRLKIESYMPFRFPYLLPSARSVGAPDSGPITYLHPTHLDWGETDNKPGRVSTRGNDRFLRAFFRAAQDGADVRCIILDRGADREVARTMIAKSGVADRFEWMPAQTQAGLRALFGKADIITEGFDVGAFGAIGMEAMAQGKPVMMHLDPDASGMIYDDPPPILNCRSEEEVFQAIVANQDRDALRERGDRAERWVQANHRDNPDLDEIAYRMAIAGGIDWPLAPKGEERPSETDAA